MLNDIKLELYNMLIAGYDGQCTIIYRKNGTNYLEHLHNKKFILKFINNISFDSIVYICCQKGYSIIKKISNPAVDTETGVLPFSSYDNVEHIKFYAYMENIYKQFGVENYED